MPDDARTRLFASLGIWDVANSPQFETWIVEAWAEDPLDTLRLLFHARDCRGGGNGHRAPFLAGMAIVANTWPDWFGVNAHLVPEYGRWKDLIELLPRLRAREHRECIARHLARTLQDDRRAMHRGEPVSLLAKWMPSEGKRWDKCTRLTTMVCAELFATSDTRNRLMRRYRVEYISPLRAYLDVVERKLCGQEWDRIDFTKVPSLAMRRLRRTFKRRLPESFAAWTHRATRRLPRVPTPDDDDDATTMRRILTRYGDVRSPKISPGQYEHVWADRCQQTDVERADCPRGRDHDAGPSGVSEAQAHPHHPHPTAAVPALD